MSVSCQNSRIEEFNFIVSILNDLAYNYEGHNKGALDVVINDVRTYIEQETKTIMSRSQGCMRKLQK